MRIVRLAQALQTTALDIRPLHGILLANVSSLSYPTLVYIYTMMGRIWQWNLDISMHR